MKTSSQKVTKLVTFSRNVVHTVSFTPAKGRVTVRCKGFPNMVVRHEMENRAKDRFVASVDLGDDTPFMVSARTPEHAFTRGVKHLWSL